MTAQAEGGLTEKIHGCGDSGYAEGWRNKEGY